jgi:hypothetical protein
MVDRHYSLNLKPWSARTLYFYAHADLALFSCSVRGFTIAEGLLSVTDKQAVADTGSGGKEEEYSRSP